MKYMMTYRSSMGDITLASDGEVLTGLWLEGQKYYARGLERAREEKDFPVFRQATEWLDIYFSGKEPGFTPPLLLQGSDFRKEVWAILTAIPYGRTRTYGDIARELAQKRRLPRMSAQAVGGAVGHNSISIIVPCHRVVGANGNLTGYAGGIEKKIALLKLEGVNTDGFFVPARSTAP